MMTSNANSMGEWHAGHHPSNQGHFNPPMVGFDQKPMTNLGSIPALLLTTALGHRV
ncbi:MAG: hypothetical protein WA871_05595 [Candidatus Acidiferrales bacterium]